MVATYDRGGISFVYPDNWVVSEESPQSFAQCVTVQSPGSGFWMVQVFQTDETPERLAEAALFSIEQDYDEIEVTRVEEDIEGTAAIGYDLHFYCLDFIVCSKVRSFSLAARTFVLVYQAEDNEFDRIGLVFSAMTASLLSESKRLAAQHAEDPQ
jgi:hypothetical protein